MPERDVKEPVSVGLPRSLIKKIDEACRAERRSRSNYIEVVLRKHLKQLEEGERPSKALV